MLNFLKKLLILLIAIVIRFGLLSSLGIDMYFDFVLIALFFWALKPLSSIQLYSLAFIGGLLTDLFIGLPLGTKTLMYLLFCFVLYFTRKNLWRSFSYVSLLIVLFVSFFLFEVIKTYYFSFLGIPVNFQILIGQILINTFLAFLTAFIFKKKVFDNV